MASNSRRYTRAGIAAAAAAVALSPGARRLIRGGLLLAAAGAVKAGTVVVRGTRNLQEASKHVTRFGNDDVEDGSAR